MNNIKEYRDKELKLYMIANLLLILATSKIISYDEITGNIDYIKTIIGFLNISLISGFTSIITFLLDSMYSSNMKSKLLNIFNLIHPPGEMIFTDLFNNDYKDNRINYNDVVSVYSEIKSSIENMNSNDKRKYENSNWYKIYHKYRDVDMIWQSNKDYLLCRDLFIASINIIIIYLIFSKILKVIVFSSTYFISIIILAFISNISAHGKAKRMVYNVIAYDLGEIAKSLLNN